MAAAVPARSKPAGTNNSGLQMLALMEQDVVGKCARLGREHPSVAKAFEALALKYNGVAMRLTEEGQFQTAHTLLTKAELLSQQASPPERAASQAKLLGVTVSNLGCFYQKTGDPHRALQYLEKALAIESVPGGRGNPAGTLLNICAVLSSLGRHEKALEHAQRAIHLLTVDCSSLITEARSTPAIPSLNPSSDGPEASHVNASSSSGSERPGNNTYSGGPAAPPAEDCTRGAAAEVSDVSGRVADDVSRERRSSHGRAGVLAVAYHSRAVQQEFLNALEDAHVSYREAVRVAESCWGAGHGMTQTLRASLLDFAKKHRAASSGGNQHRNGTSCNQNGSAELAQSTSLSKGPVSKSTRKREAEGRHWDSNLPSPRGLRVQRWLADEKRRGCKPPEKPRKEARARVLTGTRPENPPERCAKNMGGEPGVLVQRWTNDRALVTSPEVFEVPRPVAAVLKRAPADTEVVRKRILQTRSESGAEAATLFPCKDESSECGCGMAKMLDGRVPALESDIVFLGEETEDGDESLEDESGRLDARDEDTMIARPGTAPVLGLQSRELVGADECCVEMQNRDVCQLGQRALTASGASDMPGRPKTAPSGEALRNVATVTQESVGYPWGGIRQQGARRGKVKSLNALQLPKGRSKDGREEFPSVRSPSAPALQKYLGSAQRESIFDSRPKGPPVKDNDYASVIRDMATLVMKY